MKNITPEEILKIWRERYMYSKDMKGQFGNGFYNGFFTALEILGINPFRKKENEK